MSEQISEKLEQLWSLTAGRSFVDREALREAVDALRGAELDYRSRRLVEESDLALQGLVAPDAEFPTLVGRIGVSLKKLTIEQYLRELGTTISSPAKVIIGGSSALILKDLLARNTEDIDIVDEVPEPIRELHEWRAKAKKRFGLFVAHFQSHYLPQGWEKRVHSLGSYGKLEAYVVDPIDIFVRKLFSKREKDLDDIRALVGYLPRAGIDERLSSAKALRSDPERELQAGRNYYILFGQEPPTAD